MLVLVYLGRNIRYMIIIPTNQQPLSVSVSHMIMMESTKMLAQDIGTDLLSYKYLVHNNVADNKIEFAGISTYNNSGTREDC